MKTKRRHDLQTNLLADWIGKQVESIKPYSNHIIVGVVAIVVVVGFIVAMSGGQSQSAARAWQAYFTATMQEDPDSLSDVATNHPNSVASLWAKQTAGDIHLREGTTMLFTDAREEGLERVEMAKAAFEEVAGSGKAPLMLRQRAMFALAQALETLAVAEEDPTDSLDEAKEKYSDIADRWPNSVIGRTAAENVSRLEDVKTVDFYKFFAAYEPPDPSAPPTETPDPLAEFPDLPIRPDLSFPGDDELTAFDNDFVLPGNEEDGVDDSGTSEKGDDAKSSSDESSADGEAKKEKSND